MKKILTSTLVITSIILAPTLKADSYSNTDADSEMQTEAQVQQSDEEEAQPDEGTEVGQAANEGTSAAKKRQWQNIALAVGAVAVAVTALILVSSNNGHSKD